MVIKIDGVEYYTATDVVKDVGVSRQTLWRWRKHGKIPTGHRFRDRQVVFTIAEVNRIKEYAMSVEPIDSSNTKQLGLFNGNNGSDEE